MLIPYKINQINKVLERVKEGSDARYKCKIVSPILHLLLEEEDISNIFTRIQMLVVNNCETIKLRETPKTFSTKDSIERTIWTG